jgi:hypothetical protein
MIRPRFVPFAGLLLSVAIALVATAGANSAPDAGPRATGAGLQTVSAK